MKDVLTIKKPSPALRLSVQLARIALSLAMNEEQVAEDSFRDLLLDHSPEFLSRVKAIDVANVSDAAYEHICCLMEDSEYDPGLAARESEAGFFLDLDTILTRLRRDLQHSHAENQRLLPTTSFCVGVDGSRQSYLAFELTTRLRRQGRVIVAHVDEDQGNGAHSSIQLPAISTDFIISEFKMHASRLRVPDNRLVIESVKDASPSSSVASQLLDTCAAQQTDFLVLGTIGKGGPEIDQVGHVPRDVLRFAPLPVLLIPPSPSPSMPARSSVFVVAIGCSADTTERCLQAVLKLMRPSDSVRFVHFYKKPLVGVYDDLPFDVYRGYLKTLQLNGEVDVIALEPRETVTDNLQDYVAKYKASFLVLGLGGPPSSSQDDYNGLNDGAAVLENPIGHVTAAMLFSPRCTICICP